MAVTLQSGAKGNARNLATQIRSQSAPVVADAVLNLQGQIDGNTADINTLNNSITTTSSGSTAGTISYA